MTDTSIRLAKRVAEMVPCSRAEAEKYIAGGYVSVDGQSVEEAGARVEAAQDVQLAPDATLDEMPPVTILLHKPAGYNGGLDDGGKPSLECLSRTSLLLAEHGNQRFLRRHLDNLTLTSPIEASASGLMVFTQDFRIARKLVGEEQRVEQELIVEVAGTLAEGGLAALNHGMSFNGKPLAPMKVSWQNEHKLRFALKGVRPGQIVHMCRMVGLKVVGVKRIRIGRVPMASLPIGQWRYMQGYEKF
jgi:23S rRNA pseudouridine2604 synthase